jgi:hypothetical protein
MPEQERNYVFIAHPASADVNADLLNVNAPALQ